MNKFLTLVGILASAATAHAVGIGDALDSLRTVAVQDNGRVKPLDTIARERLLNIAGDTSLKGEDPIQSLFSMMAKPEEWQDRPVIFVSWMPLKEKLGMDKKEHYISLSKLLQNEKFQAVMQDLQETQASGEELDGEQKEHARLYHRAMTLKTAMDGSSLLVLPRAGAPNDPWLSPATDVVGPEDPNHAVQTALNAMVEAFGKQDAAGFETASRTFKDELTTRLKGSKVEPWKLDLEVRYNQLRPFTVAAWLALLATLILGINLVRRESSRILELLGTLGLVGVTVLTTYGLGVRVVLSARGPISNIYETMIYIGWGCATFGLILSAVYGVRFYGTGAALMSGIILLVADHTNTSFDPFITPLVPVLKSNWLWFHVQVIILGYAGLFLTITMAHLRLAVGLFLPSRTDLTRKLDPAVHRSMQLGSVALGIGIILGGIWADYSWGRYWGWDPKETWSLITLLCYMAVMHGRFAGMLGGFGTAIGAVLGVFPLLMCYYGVNFLLVGLHSYAGADTNAGTGFLAKLMTIPWSLKCFVSFEVLFMALCFANKPSRPVVDDETPAKG